MEQSSPRVLFLYAYLQPFLLAGIRSLITNYGATVMVVSWPLPSMIPLELPKDEHIEFLVKEKDKVPDIKKAILKFDPEITYSVGWMDKDYMKWAAIIKKNGRPTIMAMDNQWLGTLRQKLNCMLAPFYLHAAYTHAWVPGYPQYEYARRLGFNRERILLRLYTPDAVLFEQACRTYKAEKETCYPHAFLYTGRLVEWKFGKLLRAFTTLNENERKGWKLIVAGDGPLKNHEAFNSDNIDYRGFLQPNELVQLIREAGVFCLLSDIEPWGTVIEEFAHGGMPLMLSANCGAHYSFLVDGYNGVLVRDTRVENIRKQLIDIINYPDELLLKMGERSYSLATSSQPDVWAGTLMSVYNEMI